jgi:hypothetical protein
VWLLLPSKKKTPVLKAKIVKKNKDRIEIKVTIEKKGTWNLTIP